jgi:hypothetical protein
MFYFLAFILQILAVFLNFSKAIRTVIAKLSSIIAGTVIFKLAASSIIEKLYNPCKKTEIAIPAATILSLCFFLRNDIAKEKPIKPEVSACKKVAPINLNKASESTEGMLIG